MTIQEWNDLKVGDQVFHKLSRSLRGKALIITDIWEKPTSGFQNPEMKHGLSLSLEMSDGKIYHTSGLNPKLYVLTLPVKPATPVKRDIRESPEFDYPILSKIWNWLKRIGGK